MRHAVVKRRRTDPRHPLVYVICPLCRSAHWLPDTGVGRCPRMNGAVFTIRREPR